MGAAGVGGLTGPGTGSLDGVNDQPSDGSGDRPSDPEWPEESGVADEPGEPEDRTGDDPSPGGPAGDMTHTALPPKVESWRRRSATGAILTGFALGLQQALEKQREDPSIVVVTSGDPPDDLPVEADFEYGRPRQSVVNIRPWLLTDPDAANARMSTSGPDKGDGEEGPGPARPGEQGPAGDGSGPGGERRER